MSDGVFDNLTATISFNATNATITTLSVTTESVTDLSATTGIIDSLQAVKKLTVGSVGTLNTNTNVSAFYTDCEFHRNVKFTGEVDQSNANSYFPQLHLFSDSQNKEARRTTIGPALNAQTYRTLFLPSDEPVSGQYLTARRINENEAELVWLKPTTVFLEDFANTITFFPPAARSVNFDNKKTKELNHTFELVQELPFDSTNTNTAFNLKDSDLRYGILEVQQDGHVSVPSSVFPFYAKDSYSQLIKAPFKHTFDSVITFRVKPKFSHKIRVENATLGTVRIITPNLPGETLIVDGVFNADTGLITVGEQINGEQKVYLAIGGDNGEPLKWKLKEQNIGKCFVGIYNLMGFVIDVADTVNVPNPSSCLTEISSHCNGIPHGELGHIHHVERYYPTSDIYDHPYYSNFSHTISKSLDTTLDGRDVTLKSKYTYDCDTNKLIDVTLWRKNEDLTEVALLDPAKDFFLDSAITITATGTNKKFVLPGGFVNLNIVIVNNVVSMKVNDFIISQFNLSDAGFISSDIEYFDWPKHDEKPNILGVKTNKLNMYVDLIKIDQFKELNDDIFGDNRNIR